MTYQDGDYVAVHAEPVWRTQSNFVFRVFIGKNEGVNEWEQLWWQQVAPTRFVLCCIPFFVYNLSLGDEVETAEDYVVRSIRERSGQVTFRVWFGGAAVEVKEKAMDEIQRLRPFVEWSSPNLVALSIDGSLGQELSNILQLLENEGVLQYEAGSHK